ncbi:MAG: GspH/FimT family pseudopilin [Phycisphaeraceae bacterium]
MRRPVGLAWRAANVALRTGTGAPCPSRREGRRSRGYTLVEVLIVVTIVGVAGAIVVPQMLASGTMGIQAAARSVIADLLYAQNEAIAQQSAHGVRFDVANDRYQLIDDNGDTIPGSWRMGGGGAGYAIDLQRDERFKGVELVTAAFTGDASDTIWFDVMGAPDGGGEIVLQFEETRYRVEVASFTGRVTVELVE